MGKRYNQSSDSKYQQFDDDFEDFGYEVKNIRRQTKKKVTKFKREVNEYDDTYWSGTLISHSSLDRVFYTCSRDFLMHFLITDIDFDCSLDDADWTIKDQLETEAMLPHSYIGSTWEADSEEDLLEEISCASGWLINALDYKIVLR